MGISNKNVLAKAYKKFQRSQHAEMHLLAFKAQNKARIELSLDIVSRSKSRCRTLQTLHALTWPWISFLRYLTRCVLPFCSKNSFRSFAILEVELGINMIT